MDASYTGPHLPAVPSFSSASSGGSTALSSSSSSSSASDALVGSASPMAVEADAPNGSVRPAGPSPAELVADEQLVNAHGISLAFVKGLMAEYKAQRGLPRKYSLEILLRLNGLLRTLPSLVAVPFPPGATAFNVCGDTHGQFYDTLRVRVFYVVNSSCLSLWWCN